MKSQKTLSIYNRNWSKISLLYRVEQIKQTTNPIARYKETLLLRRRSDYFYIEQPPGSSLVFLPDSFYREFWESISIALILYQEFIIFYALTYTTKYAQEHMSILLCCDFLFVFEIFANLNTGYFSEGVLVKFRQKIVSKYAKSYFFPDFLACFPFQLFFDMRFDSEPDPDTKVSDYFKLIWLLKLLNVFKLMKIYSNFGYRFTSELIFTVFSISKFFICALMLIHWMSCLMYLFFLKDLKNCGMDWNYIYDSGSNVYIKYFYMMVFTMTSVGYGDIVPFSINQKILAIGVMSLTCWVFAFILSKSRDLFLKYNSIETYFKEMIFRMKKYMNKKSINRRLRLRVISYLQFLKENKKKKNLKEEQVLDLLSPTLREDVYIITRGSIIERCLAFKYLSLDFLRMITRSLDHSIFAPNDTIIKEGERSNSIYFIMNGKVEIYHEKTQTVFKELDNFKHFGEIGFLLGKIRVSSARSLVFSEVLHMSKYTMDEMLNNRPKDLEAHRVMLLQAEYSLNILGVKCYLCNRGGHVAKDCRKFVISIDKLEFAKNANNKKYNLNKKVRYVHKWNNDSLDLLCRYSKRSSLGDKNGEITAFPVGTSLQERCEAYANQQKMLNYKIRIKKENFEESEGSEEIKDSGGRGRSNSFALPDNLQYSNLFMKRKSIDSSVAPEVISNFEWSDETQIFTFGQEKKLFNCFNN